MDRHRKISTRDKNIEEFQDLMHQIKELTQEAYALLPDDEQAIKDRAYSYWHNTIIGCVDGRASMHTMEDTLKELEELG